MKSARAWVWVPVPYTLNSMFARLETDHEMRNQCFFHDFVDNDHRLRPFTVEV